MPAEFLRHMVARVVGDPDNRAVAGAHGTVPLPLNLHLTLRGQGVSRTDSLDVLMHLLVIGHRRLRELYIVASSPGPLVAFVDAVSPLTMPSLDTLAIIYKPMESSKKPKDQVFPVAFDILDGRAPCLRRVELRNCGLPVSPASHLPSLRELSTVVGPFTPNDLSRLATMASGLTHLTFVGQCPCVARGGFASSLLHFPALQNVRLCGTMNLPALFQQLEAPELLRMQIEDWSIDDVEMLDQCIHTITSTALGSATKFPGLRWLGLEVHAVWRTAPSIALERLCRFIALFPTLEHITFSGNQVSAFLPILASSAPLPALESISLFGAHDRRFLNEVAAFAKKRMDARRALREVGLSVLATASEQWHLLPLALCKILKVYSYGTSMAGVIYPDDRTWMHSTYEREGLLTTEYLHWRSRA